MGHVPGTHGESELMMLRMLHLVTYVVVVLVLELRGCVNLSEMGNLTLGAAPVGGGGVWTVVSLMWAVRPASVLLRVCCNDHGYCPERRGSAASTGPAGALSLGVFRCLRHALGQNV